MNVTLREWVRWAFSEHGEEWASTNYKIACDAVGNKIPYESFSRTLRLVRAEYAKQGKQSNIESYEVETQTQIESFADLDRMQWEPQSLQINTWGNENNPNKQIKTKYKARSGPTPNDFADEFLRLINEKSPKYPKIRDKKIQSGLTIEVCIPDFHMGRKSWGSAKEAKGVFLNAIETLMRPYKKNEFSNVIFPVGNDYLNYDNANHTTTAGTPQSTSDSTETVIGIGQEALIEAIDYLCNYGNVDVVVIPGNHDWLLSHMLGKILEAWYRQAPHVKVDTALESWKYRSFGKWLLGITHGKDPETRRPLKPEQLAGALPLKAPKQWADSIYREVQVGHLHNKTQGFVPWISDENSVVVRRISSLAPSDSYELANLYNSMREAESIVFDETGPTETRSFRL